LAIVLGIVSGLLTQWWNVSTHVPLRLVFISFSSTIAGFFVLLFILGASTTGWVERNVLPFRDSLTRRSFIISTTLALSLAIVIVLLTTGFSFGELIKNPGGLFAIVSGVATFIGVYITLQSIHELRQTISSFPELVDRVCDLIDSTRVNTPSNDYIRFMAFTPFIGSLSLPERETNRLRSKLVAEAAKVEIVCLDKKDLQAFHQLFLGRITDRGKISQEIIDQVYKDTETILDTWNGTKRPKRKSQDRLPGYYLFANSRRAILAMPFFMPLPSDFLNQTVIQSLPPVQMFGFETGDSGIIQSVHRMLDLYRDEVPDDAHVYGEFTGTFDEVRRRIEDLVLANATRQMRISYRLDKNPAGTEQLQENT